jgi:hypothetical protein
MPPARGEPPPECETATFASSIALPECENATFAVCARPPNAKTPPLGDRPAWPNAKTPPFDPGAAARMRNCHLCAKPPPDKAKLPPTLGESATDAPRNRHSAYAKPPLQAAQPLDFSRLFEVETIGSCLVNERTGFRLFSVESSPQPNPEPRRAGKGCCVTASYACTERWRFRIRLR